MCELLGLCFNVEVPTNVIGKAFKPLAEENPHGWGVGFYFKNKLVVAKEPIKATESKLYDYLLPFGKATSKIFIVHLRYKSKGVKTYENTHPFSKELVDKQWCFAHNGTIHDLEPLKTFRYKPEGKTDSERVFCFILEQIENKGFNYTKEDFIWLEKLLNRINELGTLNILMSDGEYLFCYSDNNKHPNKLYYTVRKYPFRKIKIRVEGQEEIIDLNEIKQPIESGVIVTTAEPINENEKYYDRILKTTPRSLFDIIEGEKWNKIPCGKLYVFKDGTKIYP